MSLYEELKDLLIPESTWSIETFEVTKITRGFFTGYEIRYGCMYDRPEISFSILKTLSMMFGTDEIDVDDYSQGGCESCDYGHEIQILSPTLRLDELEELIGKKLV